MAPRATLSFTLLVAALTVGCGERARLTVRQGTGPDPVLPAPDPGLVPTVDIAPAVGWREGEAPVAAPGLAVQQFAAGLEHPRWLHVLPNGDVLVAETAAPAGSGAWGGLKGWFMGKAMEKAGAAVPSADRIRLLRDADGDGIAEHASVFLDQLHSPFGMALVGDRFYVANTDALWRFPYRPGAERIDAPGEKVVDLPGMPYNHHWTKNLLASPDGRRLYVAVGSNSNVAENGMAVEHQRAAILEVDPAAGSLRVFASGLRNPVGMDWQPGTGALWTVVNERDEIGSDLVPDYLTRVEEGAFYGWPYSWYGDHVDRRVEPQRPDLVARARVPDYALGPHTASLGLVFYDGGLFPQWRGSALVGQHGSWNRRPPSGYRVVRVPFSSGRPSGMPEDVLTGFLDADGNARGRPVGVAVAADGALLVADDVGNSVWRVVPDRDPDR